MLCRTTDITPDSTFEPRKSGDALPDCVDSTISSQDTPEGSLYI